jgi:hypothetical protein
VFEFEAKGVRGLERRGNCLWSKVRGVGCKVGGFGFEFWGS